MPELLKVLLLGDSIRLSYQPFVTQSLAGKAEVVGPADNCQYSLYTLSSLDRWIIQLGEFLSEDQLHLSGAGQKACAQAVTDCVSRLMGLQ